MAQLAAARPGLTGEVPALPAGDTWVQCERCEKWRRIPAEAAGELDEGAVWFCENNLWSSFNACSVPQEVDDATLQAATDAALGVERAERGDAAGPARPPGGDGTDDVAELPANDPLHYETTAGGGRAEPDASLGGGRAEGGRGGDEGSPRTPSEDDAGDSVGSASPASPTHPLGRLPAVWEHIGENEYVGRARKVLDEDDVMVCGCPHLWPSDPTPEGCGPDCLNRLLNIECVESCCPSGARCANRLFTLRRHAPLEVLPAGGKGYGLFASSPVRAGQFVAEYVGEVLDEAEYSRRKLALLARSQRHYYFMTIGNGEVIDAQRKGGLCRFINHSCDPNCETQKWVVRGELAIGLFALRDVAAGEELSFDYNFERYGDEAQPCLCGAATCRGVIGGGEGRERDRKGKGRKGAGATSSPAPRASPAPRPPPPAPEPAPFVDPAPVMLESHEVDSMARRLLEVAIGADNRPWTARDLARLKRWYRKHGVDVETSGIPGTREGGEGGDLADDLDAVPAASAAATEGAESRAGDGERGEGKSRGSDDASVGTEAAGLAARPKAKAPRRRAVAKPRTSGEAGAGGTAAPPAPAPDGVEREAGSRAGEGEPAAAAPAAPPPASATATRQSLAPPSRPRASTRVLGQAVGEGSPGASRAAGESSYEVSDDDYDDSGASSTGTSSGGRASPEPGARGARATVSRRPSAASATGGAWAPHKVAAVRAGPRAAATPAAAAVAAAAAAAAGAPAPRRRRSSSDATVPSTPPAQPRQVLQSVVLSELDELTGPSGRLRSSSSSKVLQLLKLLNLCKLTERSGGPGGGAGERGGAAPSPSPLAPHKITELCCVLDVVAATTATARRELVACQAYRALLGCLGRDPRAAPSVPARKLLHALAALRPTLRDLGAARTQHGSLLDLVDALFKHHPDPAARKEAGRLLNAASKREAEAAAGGVPGGGGAAAAGPVSPPARPGPPAGPGLRPPPFLGPGAPGPTPAPRPAAPWAGPSPNQGPWAAPPVAAGARSLASALPSAPAAAPPADAARAQRAAEAGPRGGPADASRAPPPPDGGAPPPSDRWGGPRPPPFPGWGGPPGQPWEPPIRGWGGPPPPGGHGPGAWPPPSGGHGPGAWPPPPGGYGGQNRGWSGPAPSGWCPPPPPPWGDPEGSRDDWPPSRAAGRGGGPAGWVSAGSLADLGQPSTAGVAAGRGRGSPPSHEAAPPPGRPLTYEERQRARAPPPSPPRPGASPPGPKRARWEAPAQGAPAAHGPPSPGGRWAAGAGTPRAGASSVGGGGAPAAPGSPPPSPPASPRSSPAPPPLPPSPPPPRPAGQETQPSAAQRAAERMEAIQRAERLAEEALTMRAARPSIGLHVEAGGSPAAAVAVAPDGTKIPLPVDERWPAAWPAPEAQFERFVKALVHLRLGKYAAGNHPAALTKQERAQLREKLSARVRDQEARASEDRSARDGAPAGVISRDALAVRIRDYVRDYVRRFAEEVKGAKIAK